ncbi:MAG: response regulator [Candidatus Brocadiae bacterium]|nr:response regulator [Candidatus Brocadiia bacterium]
MPATVLVVDDDAAILALFRRLLRANGADVEVADAAGATAALAAKSFDLVISDLQMPGADGLEVLDAVRRACPGAFRVLMSGSPDALVRGHGENSPAELLLEKPVSFARLRELCEEAAAGASCVRSIVDAMGRRYADSIHSAFVKDTAGRYLFMNDAGAALLGRPARAVEGERDSKIFERGTLSEEIRGSDQAVLRTGRPYLYVNAMRGPGHGHVFLSAKFPVRDGTGRIRAIGCLSPEITSLPSREGGDRAAHVGELLRELNEAAAILDGGSNGPLLERPDVERLLAADTACEVSAVPAPFADG